MELTLSWAYERAFNRWHAARLSSMLSPRPDIWSYMYVSPAHPGRLPDLVTRDTLREESSLDRTRSDDQKSV